MYGVCYVWVSLKEPRFMSPDSSEAVLCESAFPFSERKRKKEKSPFKVYRLMT
jgi:hypothetical protein